MTLSILWVLDFLNFFLNIFYSTFRIFCSALFKLKDVENKYLCYRMVLMHMHLRAKNEDERVATKFAWSRSIQDY